MLVTVRLKDVESLLVCSPKDCSFKEINGELHLIYSDKDVGIPIAVYGMTEEEFIQAVLNKSIR